MNGLDNIVELEAIEGSQPLIFIHQIIVYYRYFIIMSTTKKSNTSTDIMAVKQTPLPQFQMACVLFVQICEALNGNFYLSSN